MRIHFPVVNNRGDPPERSTRFPDTVQATTPPGGNPFHQLPSADLELGKYTSLTQTPFPSHTLVVPDSDHTVLVKRQNPDSLQTRLMRNSQATEPFILLAYSNDWVTRSTGSCLWVEELDCNGIALNRPLGQAPAALFSKAKKAPKNRRKSSKRGLQ